jgi:hypothetical protein
MAGDEKAEKMVEKLTELEVAKLNLLRERDRRIHVESQSIRQAVVRLEQERATLGEEQRKLGEALKVVYKLQDNDVIDLDGVITRAPVQEGGKLPVGPLPEPTIAQAIAAVPLKAVPPQP